MSKIYLTIEARYRPTWGATEGIRELMQNGIDAQVEYGAKLSVDHYTKSDGTGVLRIENDGCTLDREALLLGNTSKGGRRDLIGQFGDGLKIGVLALVRTGHVVKIRNGSEVWLASIEPHPKLHDSNVQDEGKLSKALVLCFDIQSNRKHENRVRVEIEGISFDYYQKIKTRFLCLGEKKPSIQTDNGELFVSQDMKGKIFVKGIFVEERKDLAFGYNFSNAQVDIERKIVDEYERTRSMRQIWNEAVGQRPDLLRQYMGMLDDQTADLAGVDEYSAPYIPENIKDYVVEQFRLRHGEDAILVSSLSESKEAMHLGKRGIVAPRGLAALLRTKLQSFDQEKEKLLKEAVREYGFSDLEPDELAFFEKALLMMQCASLQNPLRLNDLSIVDFRSSDLNGLCHSDGRIQIAKKCLSSLPFTLRVLVHENAHRVSKALDGEKAHVSEIERQWSEICFKYLSS